MRHPKIKEYKKINSMAEIPQRFCCFLFISTRKDSKIICVQKKKV